MSFSRGTLVMSLIISLFASCQKELENPGPEDPQGEELFIKGLIFLDTTRPVGHDTILKRVYEYDGASRLIRSETFGYSYPPDAFSIIVRSISRLTYSGTNEYPDKITFENLQFNIPGNDYYDTLYLFYQNGIVKRDSATSSVGNTRINQYDQFSTTRSRIITRIMDNSGDIIDTSYAYTEWANGNLVKEIDSTYFHLLPQNLFINESLLTYDSKKNPFRKMFITHVHPACVNKAYGVPVEFELFCHPGENNILTLNSDAMGNSTVEYWYNNNGLPVSATINDQGPVYKAYYQYTTL